MNYNKTDIESQNALMFVKTVIENETAGRLLVPLTKYFKLSRLAEIFNKALGKDLTVPRYRQLFERYKGGEKHDKTKS